MPNQASYLEPCDPSHHEKAEKHQGRCFLLHGRVKLTNGILNTLKDIPGVATIQHLDLYTVHFSVGYCFNLQDVATRVRDELVKHDPEREFEPPQTPDIKV